MKKSQLRQIIREEISKTTDSDKIIKLLRAAQKLIEDNIENAHNIDLEMMEQQIDKMIDELNKGFEVYDWDED